MTDVEYYQIEAHSEDWIMILGPVLAKHNPTPEDVQIVIDPNSITRFMIKRSFISPAEIAKALGTTEALVSKAKRLVLNPLPGQEGWQKPTVHYVGKA